MKRSRTGYTSKEVPRTCTSITNSPTATNGSYFGLETSIDEADGMPKLAINRPRGLS